MRVGVKTIQLNWLYASFFSPWILATVFYMGKIVVGSLCFIYDACGGC